MAIGSFVWPERKGIVVFKFAHGAWQLDSVHEGLHVEASHVDVVLQMPRIANSARVARGVWIGNVHPSVHVWIAAKIPNHVWALQLPVVPDPVVSDVLIGVK